MMHLTLPRMLLFQAQHKVDDDMQAMQKKNHAGLFLFLQALEQCILLFVTSWAGFWHTLRADLICCHRQQ